MMNPDKGDNCVKFSVAIFTATRFRPHVPRYFRYALPSYIPPTITIHNTNRLRRSYATQYRLANLLNSFFLEMSWFIRIHAGCCSTTISNVDMSSTWGATEIIVRSPYELCYDEPHGRRPCAASF